MRTAAFAVALLAAAAPAAGEDGWSVDLEALRLELSGHDRTVLVDRALDAGGGASTTSTTLASESALAYRGELRYGRGRWSYGLDFLSHRTDQVAERRTGAAGGAVVRRTFVVGGGQVESRGPGERLYYQRLDDTTVELWTLDLIAARAFASGPRGELRFLFGVRAADFDNDYRAVAGVEERGGLRLDASSNYDRMHGPIVALAGAYAVGRNRCEGYLGQAVVWGDVELTSGVREFAGPPSLDVDEVPGVVAGTRFQETESVSIPITELRLRWRFRLAEHFELGAGAFASRWGGVAVPPGVVAGAQLSTRDENTIETYGLSAGVAVIF
jgi:hypothetical protein